MAEPPHRGTWGGSFQQEFLKGYELEIETDDESLNSDSSSSGHSTGSDIVKDCNSLVDLRLENLVSKRDWSSVYRFFQQVMGLDAGVKNLSTLPELHPGLYLTVYREHVVDLLIDNKESEARRLYNEKVHALCGNNSGYAVRWKIEEQILEVYNILMDKIQNPVQTESAKTLMRIDFYLRLYCGDFYGHGIGSNKSHLWQFVIAVTKKSPQQLNPCYRCLACGKRFTNCTISKFREHMKEEGKFPTCKFITMNMRLRYSLGESEKPETSKASHRPLRMKGKTSAKKNHRGGYAEMDVDDADTRQCKQMRIEDQTIAKKNIRAGYVDVDSETQQRERTRMAEIAKGSKRCQGERGLRHLVNAVCNNIAAFCELFGDRDLSLAVKSDLNIARDMMWQMIPKQPEIGETLGEGTAICDLASVARNTADKGVEGSHSPEMVHTPIDSTAQDKIGDDSAVDELAAIVRKNVAFLFKFYREKKLSQEFEKELMAAEELLSKIVPGQK